MPPPRSICRHCAAAACGSSAPSSAGWPRGRRRSAAWPSRTPSSRRSARSWKQNNGPAHLFAEVALNVPLHAGDRVFTFGIPQSLEPRISLGSPVRVPFGRHTSLGFVVRLAEQVDRRVRLIAAVEDRLPMLPEDLVALAWWMAGHYVCAVGVAGAVMPPPAAAARRKKKGGTTPVVRAAARRPRAPPPAA